MTCWCPKCSTTIFWDWCDLGHGRACPACGHVFAVDYTETYHKETGEVDEFSEPREVDVFDAVGGVWEGIETT